MISLSSLSSRPPLLIQLGFRRRSSFPAVAVCSKGDRQTVVVFNWCSLSCPLFVSSPSSSAAYPVVVCGFTVRSVGLASLSQVLGLLQRLRTTLALTRLCSSSGRVTVRKFFSALGAQRFERQNVVVVCARICSRCSSLAWFHSGVELGTCDPLSLYVIAVKWV